MPTSQVGTGDSWGSRLSPDSFARALAAAGVLAAIDASRRSARSPSAELMPASAVELLHQLLARLVDAESPLLRWEMPVDGNGVPPSWMPTPESLGEIWERAFDAREKWFRDRYVVDGQGRTRNEPPKTGVRLQLPAGFELLEDAEKSLVGQHTRIDSLAALITRSTPKPQWNWPIKLRLLGARGIDRLALQKFRSDVLQARQWIAEHLTLLPDRSEDRADFTLLLDDTGTGVDAFADLPEVVVNGDCLIVATPLPKSGDIPTPASAAKAFLDRFRATGLVSQPGLRVGDWAAVVWVIEFVRELSHTVTVDVAATRAAARANFGPPTLRLSKAVLEYAHVSRRQAMIVARLKQASPIDAVTGIPRTAQQALGVEASISARALVRALRDRLTPLDFDRESNGASIVAAIAVLVDNLPVYPTALRSAPRRPVPPRYVEYGAAAGGPTGWQTLRFLQARLLSVQSERLMDEFRALKPQAPCFVRVRIGGEDRAWPGFGDEPFPTELLPPPNAGGWTLQVYAFTNSGEPAQNASMFLPAVGDSDPIEFKCMAGDGTIPFKARIVVAHANRVLQSAWLEAPVETERGEVRGSFARGLEVVVKQNLTQLDHRSEFGAFLILNDSLTNGPGVAIASGPSAVLRTPPDLAKTISFIDGELTKVSDKPEQYEGGLESKAVVRLLRSLAQYGREMFEAIVEDHHVDQGPIDAKRVQVVAAEAWARLPIEFFFDQPAPEPNAPLCPGAVKCLGGAMAAAPGPCNDACPTAGDPTKVVCPRGFWGLRKVIEWHRHSGDKVQDGDFRLQSEPTTHRKSIKAFQSVLFAHSDRVDAYCAQASADVLAALKGASSLTNTATDWDLWRTGVSSHSPLLMVMLPHNEESANALPELSIGPGTLATHRLLLSSIDDRVVKGPKTIPGGIVMLLGCETGAPKTSYLGYVPKLRRYGASIIVSTGAVVLGRQISPICVRLINGLRAAVRNGPTPLGEVMLRLRREALADGFPIVLALSASGDADWLIE